MDFCGPGDCKFCTIYGIAFVRLPSTKVCLKLKFVESHFINVRARITFHITRTRIIMEMYSVLWVLNSDLDISTFIEV
jgi:hypothetical protein